MVNGGYPAGNLVRAHVLMRAFTVIVGYQRFHLDTSLSNHFLLFLPVLFVQEAARSCLAPQERSLGVSAASFSVNL